MGQIVLASASPRRKELLEQIGLSFVVVPAKGDETVNALHPAEVVLELAAQKAEEVAAREDCKEAVIIAADTIVALGQQIFGKPADEESAVQMLHQLQGNTHSVYTGVAVLYQGRRIAFFEETKVTMYPMSEEEIRAYVATGEPMDKAGAYAIQGLCAVYIKEIAGDYNNVVGLPVARLYQECRKAGIDLFANKQQTAGASAQAGQTKAAAPQKASEKVAGKDWSSPIKLIATDIDGTLLEEGTNQLNPEYYEVIPRLRKEKGILFAAASGRQHSSIRRLFEPIIHDVICIAENGSYMVCRGEPLLQMIMNRPRVEELIREIRTMDDCELTVSAQEMMYLETKDEAFVDWLENGYRNDLRVVEDVLAEPISINKVSIYRRAGVEEIADRIKERWSGDFQVVVAGDVWIDFMDYRADKGQALRLLQRMTGIEAEETMAFGDNCNDIGMLQAAGESYAIGNAREEVRQAAKHIADTNANHGVLQVLKSLLDKEK